MAESVAQEAHRLSHEKASFLNAAVQGLRRRLQASTEKFQAYFLALSRIKITRRCWKAWLRSTKPIRRRPLHPPKPSLSLRASLLALTG